MFGQYGADGAQHAVHFGLGFADGQAADGEAGEVELFQPAQGLFAQVFIHRALHDAEQGVGVVQIFKGFFAAFRPAQAHLQRFFGLFARGLAGGAFVELHGDSELSTVWIFMEISGERKSLSPLIGLLKVQPSSVSLRMSDSENTWKPPESVKIGLFQPIKSCRPPNCSMTSRPGRSHNGRCCRG